MFLPSTNHFGEYLFGRPVIPSDFLWRNVASNLRYILVTYHVSFLERQNIKRYVLGVRKDNNSSQIRAMRFVT